MVLLILLFIAVLTVVLSVVTGWLVLTGNSRWDERVRRDALRMHSGGMLFGVLLTAALMGVQTVLSAWPVLAGFLAVRLGATGLLDALHGVGYFRPRAPRIIEHRDGARALVDGAGKGYQRLPLGETKPDALTAWLKERM